MTAVSVPGASCSKCSRPAAFMLDDRARTLLCVDHEHERRASIYEERSRARKAYKLSSVLLRTLAANPELRVEDLEDASRETREIASRVAGVKLPSDRTWALMIDLVRERLR